MKIVIGGPWYRTQIDVRTAVTLIGLVTHAPDHGVEVMQVTAEDGFLDCARNRLLERAIRKGADWFLSIDADCSIQAPAPVFRSLRDAWSADTALVGWPALEGGGRLNVVDLDGKRLQAPPKGLERVSRVGFGAVAFRCGWYVRNWPANAPWFHTVPVRDEANHRWHAVGEDFGHCIAVGQLGGRVLVDGRVEVGHHMSRAGSVEAQL